MKDKLFNFRRYKKKQGKKDVRHPKLIVDEDRSNYGYMGLTEQKYKGKHHINIPLEQNPKKNDNRPAYLRKKIEYDKKENFSAVLKDYKLCYKDRKFIIDYVNRHKKR